MTLSIKNRSFDYSIKKLDEIPTLWLCFDHVCWVIHQLESYLFWMDSKHQKDKLTEKRMLSNFRLLYSPGFTFLRRQINTWVNNDVIQMICCCKIFDEFDRRQCQWRDHFRHDHEQKKEFHHVNQEVDVSCLLKLGNKFIWMLIFKNISMYVKLHLLQPYLTSSVSNDDYVVVIWHL